MQRAQVFQPKSSDVKIYDWSASSPHFDYKNYFKTKSQKFNHTEGMYTSSPIHRWFSPRWVTPIFQSELPNGKVSYFPDLFRLIAATNMVLLTRPGKTPEPFNIRACINAPHAILVGNSNTLTINHNNSVYSISWDQCMLTNCIHANLPKNYTTFIIIHQPSYVMIPVLLNDDWYDDEGSQILKKTNELIRPKRFVAALILGITALIGIITSLALSTTALVKEIHTAHHVNDLSHNVSLALAIQENIDKNWRPELMP